jgi:hypothetical protein
MLMAKLSIAEIDLIEKKMWQDFLLNGGDPAIATTESITKEYYECCESS